VITYGDYLAFNGSATGGNTAKLSKYVGPDNLDRSIVMRGLPYRVTQQDVLSFCDGYGSLTQDDIIIEEFNGKRTGSALVIFENRDVAQDAKAALNMKEMG
jgi:RNA recognition motif-containing protein